MMDMLVQIHEVKTIKVNSKQAFIVVAMFLIFSVMMSTALISVMPNNVVDDYDSDDYV